MCIRDRPITYDIEKDGLFKKGVLKGLEQGLVKGLKEGEKKGTTRGIEQTLLAIKCLKEGKTIKETSVLTDLTQKKIKEIKEQLS